jgi:hypothetical protein
MTTSSLAPKRDASIRIQSLSINDRLPAAQSIRTRSDYAETHVARSLRQALEHLQHAINVEVSARRCVCGARTSAALAVSSACVDSRQRQTPDDHA